MRKPVFGNYEYDKMSRDVLNRVIKEKFTWITIYGVKIIPRPYTSLEKKIAKHALSILDAAQERLSERD